VKAYVPPHLHNAGKTSLRTLHSQWSGEKGFRNLQYRHFADAQ